MRRKEEAVVLSVGVLLAAWVTPTVLTHGGKIGLAVLVVATGLAVRYVWRSSHD